MDASCSSLSTGCVWGLLEGARALGVEAQPIQISKKINQTDHHYISFLPQDPLTPALPD